jgi:hypothetical protein
MQNVKTLLNRMHKSQLELSVLPHTIKERNIKVVGRTLRRPEGTLQKDVMDGTE